MRSNRSMPASTVIPVLGYDDVGEAVAWLCDTFGFGLRWRAGDHRAQLHVGDGAVAVTERPHGAAAGGVDSVLVRIDDVDAHHARALGRGAVIVSGPADYPYGERQYTVDDIGGHRWTFSESTADVDPASWGATTVLL